MTPSPPPMQTSYLDAPLFRVQCTLEVPPGGQMYSYLDLTQYSCLDRAAEATGRYRVNKEISQSISTYSVFIKTILQIVIDHHGVS